MPSTYEFSLKPVTERKVPTFERIIDRARHLTSASANWEPGKSVSGHGDVKTFSHKDLKGMGKKGPKWYARVSKHANKPDRNAFDDMWDILAGPDRYKNEIAYNEDLTSATLLKTVQWGEVWSLHYTFPPPVSPRTCTILTTTHLETSSNSPRIGWIVSIPFEVASDDVALSLFVEVGVSSKLISVERLREMEDGTVEWLAASCSSPGGSIPLFVSEYFALKRMVSHVTKLETWLNQRDGQSSTDQVTPSASQVSTSGSNKPVLFSKASASSSKMTPTISRSTSRKK